MKRFTQKFFLLSMGLMLSVGASAQTPTGAWNAFEDDGITHDNPTVLYKRGSDPNNPIYIIPAWDKRIMDNGYLRARKITADGSKGSIVTAMGLLYDENGVSGFNGQFTTPLQVWCEKTQEWLNVDLDLLNSLTYADLFEGGQSVVYVFKDSKDYTFEPSDPEVPNVGSVTQVKQVTGTNYTIPTSVAWNGGGTGTITELGPCAYGNATFASATSNKYCRSAFKNLTIPSTITKIGEYAFRGISTLEEVMIEDGGTLAAIPERCFDACWNLKKVELPSSITSIGGAAFGGCANKTSSNLNRIVFKSASAPTFGKFNNTQDIFTTPLTSYSHSNVDPAQCIIEVPLGTVDAYVASNDGYLATKKFPLCSKFPLETSSGLMTYCSETDFTFKQYNTSSKSWEAGEMKTYYVKGEDVEVGNGKVTLTEITGDVMVPGWKTGEGNDFGVVLKGTPETTYDIFYPNGRGITTTFEAEDNCLHGCVTPTDVKAGSDEDNSYFIMSGGVFKRIMKDGQCKANRAYIKISGGPDFDMGTTEESRELILAFPGENPTGISAHEVQGAQNDAWYTLQGIQVQQPSKGIFIKNGKKFVIK